MSILCAAQPDKTIAKQYWFGLALGALLWALLGLGASLV